jgi:hypothetical protein
MLNECFEKAKRKRTFFPCITEGQEPERRPWSENRSSEDCDLREVGQEHRVVNGEHTIVEQEHSEHEIEISWKMKEI